MLIRSDRCLAEGSGLHRTSVLVHETAILFRLSAPSSAAMAVKMAYLSAYCIGADPRIPLAESSEKRPWASRLFFSAFLSDPKAAADRDGDMYKGTKSYHSLDFEAVGSGTAFAALRRKLQNNSSTTRIFRRRGERFIGELPDLVRDEDERHVDDPIPVESTDRTDLYSGRPPCPDHKGSC
jgi:hypothetical protein